MSLKVIAFGRYMTDVLKVMRHRAVAVNSKREYFCNSVSEKSSTELYHPDCLRNFHLSTYLQKCWKCGAHEIKGLFCNQCKALQKPDYKLNYFQVLGVAEDYSLKESELSAKFRELQNFLHPDRYTNKDEVEQQVSAEYSALVNKAYSTLLHPLERGLYLLQMRGMQLEEGTVQDDAGFLMKIMELNEELTQAEDAEQVHRLDVANRLATEEFTKEVADAFDKGDVDAAKRALTKMKYYASIGGRIKELKQKTGIE